jgi:hypothetical protein
MKHVTYLALSGTIHGVMAARIRGAEVAIQSIFQLAM